MFPDKHFREIIHGVAQLKITIIFIIFYMIINFIILPSLTDIPVKMRHLATSPFNGDEGGLIDNFVLVTVLILATELYCRRLMQTLRTFFTIEKLFFCGLVASYFLSAFRSIFLGEPSAGTSIIGFSFSFFLTLSIFLDMPNRFKHHNLPRTPKSILILVVILAFLLFAVFEFLVTYILGAKIYEISGSFSIHFTGLLIFIILLCYMSGVKRYPTTKTKID